MIIDKTQTLLIQPECIATVLSRHVVIDIVDEKATETSSNSITPRIVDPVLLSVFGHRFMSIAEQVTHFPMLPSVRLLMAHHIQRDRWATHCKRRAYQLRSRRDLTSAARYLTQVAVFAQTHLMSRKTQVSSTLLLTY